MKTTIKRLISNRFVRYSGKTKEKAIALTFDDGPHGENTDVILKTLQDENVKATFFIIGKEAEKYPRLVKAMVRNGHEIANHSYSHTKDTNVNDIKKAGKTVNDISNISPKLFRPPWGRVTLKQIWYAIFNNMRLILWSFDSNDDKLKTARELKDYVKTARIRAGDIMLFHEDYQHTKEALPDIIKDLKSRGFTFCTVSELLG